MAVDLPPGAPAYSIERAAPTDRVVEGMRAVSAAFRGAAGRAMASVTPAASQMETTLPAIDPTSRALSQVDRRALADAIMNDDRANLAKAPPAGSYVGERIRLAADLQRINAKGTASISPQDAAAFRCRMTAVAMDRRAGAFVEGGEAAAARARASVPREVLEACRAAALQARVAQRTPQQSVQHVDPVAGRQAAAAPVRVAMDASQPRVRIDMPAPRHVHAELEKAKPVHVDLVAEKRVHVDPIARAAQVRDPSQGV